MRIQTNNLLWRIVAIPLIPFIGLTVGITQLVRKILCSMIVDRLEYGFRRKQIHDLSKAIHFCLDIMNLAKTVRMVVYPILHKSARPIHQYEIHNLEKVVNEKALEKLAEKKIKKAKETYKKKQLIAEVLQKAQLKKFKRRCQHLEKKRGNPLTGEEIEKIHDQYMKSSSRARFKSIKDYKLLYTKEFYKWNLTAEEVTAKLAQMTISQEIAKDIESQVRDDIRKKWRTAQDYVDIKKQFLADVVVKPSLKKQVSFPVVQEINDEPRKDEQIVRAMIASAKEAARQYRNKKYRIREMNVGANGAEDQLKAHQACVLKDLCKEEGSCLKD